MKLNARSALRRPVSQMLKLKCCVYPNRKMSAAINLLRFKFDTELETKKWIVLEEVPNKCLLFGSEVHVSWKENTVLRKEREQRRSWLALKCAIVRVDITVSGSLFHTLIILCEKIAAPVSARVWAFPTSCCSLDYN